MRSIPGGLSAFIKTVANGLSISEAQAKQFILQYGLLQDQFEGKIYQTLSSNLEGFTMELIKSVRFFQNKYTGAQFGGIILSGYAGIIPLMAEYIEAKTGISTIQGNPWQYVRVNEQQQKLLLPVASEFGVAIGLAERSND